jgi:CO/xanthine dehydrogenase Mo-binding subunit
VPGVQKIVVLDDLVAVVGDHMWAAKKGLDALKIDWDGGPHGQLSSNDIWEQLRAANEKDGVVARSDGDIAKGLATGERFEASYELPFLAHATMEPVNATVHLKPDSCEVWTGTQVLARVRSEAAKAAGLPVEKVIAHNHLLGGGSRTRQRQRWWRRPGTRPYAQAFTTSCGEESGHPVIPVGSCVMISLRNGPVTKRSSRASVQTRSGRSRTPSKLTISRRPT